MAAARSYAWLWLLVVLQVAIPASYYLRDSDRDDERFAWRMFSGIRLKRCAVYARARSERGDSSPIPLRGALHGSWIHAIERGRRRVIERFLVTRCGPGVASVTLERQCESVDRRRPLAPESYEYACADRAWHLTGGR